MPASTGVHGRNGISQRGVMPPHCARVLVAFASCLAAPSASVLRSSVSSAIATHPLDYRLEYESSFRRSARNRYGGSCILLCASHAAHFLEWFCFSLSRVSFQFR